MDNMMQDDAKGTRHDQRRYWNFECHRKNIYKNKLFQIKINDNLFNFVAVLLFHILLK